MRIDPHRPPPPDAAPRRLDRPYRQDELPTPALVLDLQAMERNLLRMAQHLEAAGVDARPHTKTHKCPVLGHRQMAAGAVGLCCAKVSEAEVMAAAGLDRILITSPVATTDKAERVAELSRQVEELLIVVDREGGVRLLEAAARRAGNRLRVLVDLDPGIHRTGVAMGEPARALAEVVVRCAHLELWGLQAYAGHLMHKKGWKERRHCARQIWEQVAETRLLIERDGHSLPILTGGGTGTFDIDCDVAGVTDLQVGSYVLMDREYREIGGHHGEKETELFEPFETAVFVSATAISQPVADRITVDAGFKAFATDSGRPEPLDLDGVRYHWGGDEHGILELEQPSRKLSVGDRVRLRVPHCDPTVNLYDFFYALDGDTVSELWPIAARGRSQ